MIVKVDLVLLAAPWHCEIWRAPKDSFKNRTNYVNYRTIFQFRMICRASVWQRARRSHWGLQRQQRLLLWTTAGWMFCMSNKRDFHNIIITMLRDLSAQDHVPRRRDYMVGGLQGSPWGSFYLAQRGSCPLIEKTTQGLAGRPGSPQAPAASSQSTSVSARKEERQRLDGGCDRGHQVHWIQTMCGHAYITPPSVYLFIIPFLTFNWL